MTEQQLCPHCEQGVVYRYTITQSGERFSSCEECDAAWPADVHVDEFNSTFLDDFLASRSIDRDNWYSAVTRE